MTRRSLVRRLLPIAAWMSFRWAGRPVAAQPSYPTGPLVETLSPTDLDDLVAFAEIAVGSGPLSPEARALLVDHIQFQVPRADGYYLSAYRTTVDLLRQLSGVQFATLGMAQRREIVARHRLDARFVDPDEDLGPRPAAARTVRTQVMSDLIAGYYGSPAGWATVGYHTSPGRCGDLGRYTRPGV